MAFLLPVVGSYISAGGFTTAFGWAMASMGAQAVFGEGQKGPRLTDLRSQNSSPGQVIYEVFGTVRVAGNIVWSKRIKEVENSSKGGKGGKENTTYKYYWSGAVMVCGPSEQVLEIWGNEKQIYAYNNGNQKGYTLVKDDATGTWESDRIRVATGTQTQMPDPLVEADKGVRRAVAYRGRTVVYFENLPLEKFGRSIPNFSFVVKKGEFNAKTTAEYILNKVKIEPSFYDMAAFQDYSINGFLINQRAEARHYLEILSKISNTKITEFDYKMRARKIADLPVIFVEENEIRFVDQPNSFNPTEATAPRTVDIASSLQLEYMDEKRAYNSNFQEFSRQVVQTVNQDTVSYPISCNGSEAKRIVTTELLSRWCERKKFKFTLGMQGLPLVPDDVLNIPTKSGRYLVRIDKINKIFFGLVMVEASLYDRDIYTIPQITIDNGSVGDGVENYDEPVIRFYEMPPLFGRYSANAGFYAAACAPFTLDSAYGGATIKHSTVISAIAEDKVGRNVLGISGPSVMGEATSVLAEPSEGVYAETPYDSTNTVTVEVQGVLTSSSDSGVIEDFYNFCLIGKELLQFKNVTLLGVLPNGLRRYQLSNLIRGMNGTNTRMGNHAIGDTFLLITENVIFVPIENSALGRELTWQTTWGDELSGGESTKVYTAQGEIYKPYPPTPLDYEIQEDGDVLLTWNKRTRNDDVYWDEDLEPLDSSTYDVNKFLIEIRDGITVTRSIEVGDVEEYLYTTANQTTDGFGTGDSFTVSVRQRTSFQTLASPDKAGYAAVKTVTLP